MAFEIRNEIFTVNEMKFISFHLRELIKMPHGNCQEYMM